MKKKEWKRGKEEKKRGKEARKREGQQYCNKYTGASIY